MSQFGGGRSASEMARRSGARTQGGVQASLNAPGVVTAPPVSSGSRIANELMNTVNNFGRTLSAAGNYADAQLIQLARQQAAEERAARQRQAEQEAFDKQIAETDKVMFAEGASTSKEDIPVVESDIASGRYQVPIRSEDINQFARDVVESRVQQLGLEGNMAAGYREAALPKIVSAAVARRDMVVEKAEKDTLEVLRSGVFESVKAGSFGNGNGYVADVAASTGIEPKKIVEQSVIPAMNQLAENGDRIGFSTIAKSLGSRYQEDIDSAKLKLESRERTLLSEMSEEAKRSVQVSLDQFQGGSKPFSAVMGEIDELFNRGIFNSTDLRVHRNLAEDILEEKNRAVHRQEYQRRIASINDTNVGLFAIGKGGAIQDQTVSRDPDTQEVISAETQRLEAWRTSVAAIDGDTTLTPSQKSQAIIALARTNQYEPPEWKNKIEGMNTSFNIMSFGMKPVDQVEIQNNEALIQTVGFYAQLKEQYPGYTAKLNENVRERMDAIMYEMQVNRQPADKAIYRVLRGERNKKNLTSKDMTDITTYASNIARKGNNPSNLRWLGNQIEDRIMRQMRYVDDPSVASEIVEKFVDVSLMKINDIAVLFPGDTVAGMDRNLFARSTSSWIEDKQEVFKKLNPGLDYDRLSIEYNIDNDTWAVVDTSQYGMSNPIKIDEKGTEAFFTTKQIADLIRRENYERAKRKNSIGVTNPMTVEQSTRAFEVLQDARNGTLN